jgi:hypothetical protein
VENILRVKRLEIWKRSLVFQFVAVTAIYFTPALSHASGIPFYLLEPMRILLILSIVHTNKWNAYILAISIPFFSMLVSGHPVFPKVIIITFELVMNVWLFYLLSKNFKNILFTASISIIISKILYYFIKYIFISTLLLDSDFISTPIYIQVILIIVLSVYMYLIYKPKNDI